MKRIIYAFTSMALFSLCAIAQNPIISHCYTADPAPVVFEGNDSLYVYCDEDMNVPGVNDYYYMERWRVYSTVDMVNWTDHGEAMPQKSFTWMQNGTAWASQCISRNGKYYWYMCGQKPNNWINFVGVGVSSTPSGPFKDALKKPLFETNTGGDIDPTVFIDDDNQAYIYWGNNKVCYAKLKNTMITIDKTIGNNGIVSVPLTEKAFGGVKVDGKTTNGEAFEEGPWIDKRGDNYYLIYAAGGVPEHIAYSMSKSITGPWEYKGNVMPLQDTGSFTNHSGIVHYKDKDYFFYHTGWLPGGGGFNRSISVEEFQFNEDGTIPEIKATKKGVKAIATMNPFIRQQAETLNAGVGVKVVGNESKGVYVTHIHNTDSMRVAKVDFGEGEARSITIRMASVRPNCYLVARQNNAKGKMIGRWKIGETGGEDIWEEKTFELSYVPTGVHDIHFSFIGTASTDGNTIFNWDWWKFNNEEETSILSLNKSEGENPTSWYDLTGRKVASPSKGIYIKNGHKVLLP